MIAYLLHKNPDRMHEKSLPFGRAVMCFPDSGDDFCRFALAVEVDAIGLVRGRAPGFVQPAVKCRGREYLRIIYGLNYDLPENLERLRQRALGRKLPLARRQSALGQEALERFVAGAPLRRVHECVFAVLALESEPVDPRL